MGRGVGPEAVGDFVGAKRLVGVGKLLRDWRLQRGDMEVWSSIVVARELEEEDW